MYFHPEGAWIVQYAETANNYLHVHNCDLLHEVRSMLVKVQWKILADFLGSLFKTNNIRIATPAYNAPYNLLANLSEDVVLVKRLKEHTKRKIGKCIDFLEDGPETLLTPRDIWTRLWRELADLDDFEQRLLKLKGRTPPAIETSCSVNACVCFVEVINKDSQALACRSSRILLIELADNGMLKMAALDC